MRQEQFGPGLRERTFIGLVAVAAVAPPAWAYVNGGDHHSTDRYATELRYKGWSVSVATPFPIDCDKTKEVAQGVKVTPPDNPEYQRYVNQLVGRALQFLPEKDADKVSIETKREVARLAREAIQDAVSQGQVIKKGQAGSLQYQVGVYAFESWWETNYGGKREIHERRTYFVPFVALKVEPEKDRDK